jgi:hypothetical protein
MMDSTMIGFIRTGLARAGAVSAIGRLRPAGRLQVIGLAAALGLVRAGGAAAFPLFDVTNQDQVPQGTELAAPDVHDLRHQLQIVNGLAAPVGGGWTFVPRIDFQEMLTDNVRQQHTPRQWDLVSYLSPGFSLIGDLPRVQMTLSYAPTLAIYMESSSLNSLTQQLDGLATITLVPETLYVDLRAASGVHSIYGGIGGVGTLGAGGATQTAVPVLAGNTAGLTRDNEVQTTSFGISPYLLQNFGAFGAGKVGYSLDVTRSNTLSGFASPPIPTGGTHGQTLLTNEAYAHYQTGEILQFLQNSIDFDATHGQTTTDANGAIIPGVAILNPNGTVTSLSAPPGHSTSDRIIITDRISYVLTRELLLFATGGHEDINYSNQILSGVSLVPGTNGALVPTYSVTTIPATSIHDFTWSLGATWTPNPNSSLTVSYGHQNGFDSFAANGYYQATPRTIVSVSYGSTLGTQLENVQNQLNLAAANGTGTLVNGQTGGTLFGTTNALGVQAGLFRTDTFTLGSTTSLDRDIISFNLLLTKQSTTSTVTTTATSKGFGASWLHQMRPDMLLSAAIYVSTQGQTTFNGINPGDSTSLAATIGWQYQISDTLSASVRYSFIERSSSTAFYDMYQNMLILGISRTF